MVNFYQELVSSHQYSLQILAHCKQNSDFDKLLKHYEAKLTARREFWRSSSLTPCSSWHLDLSLRAHALGAFWGSMAVRAPAGNKPQLGAPWSHGRESPDPNRPQL